MPIPLPGKLPPKKNHTISTKKLFVLTKHHVNLHQRTQILNGHISHSLSNTRSICSQFFRLSNTSPMVWFIFWRNRYQFGITCPSDYRNQTCVTYPLYFFLSNKLFLLHGPLVAPAAGATVAGGNETTKLYIPRPTRFRSRMARQRRVWWSSYIREPVMCDDHLPLQLFSTLLLLLLLHLGPADWSSEMEWWSFFSFG